MTKGQRNKAQFIEDMNVQGFIEDRWGHFKVDLGDGRRYRFKMQKASLRIERVVGKHYFRAHTIPYGKLNINLANSFITRTATCDSCGKVDKEENMLFDTEQYLCPECDKLNNMRRRFR